MCRCPWVAGIGECEMACIDIVSAVMLRKPEVWIPFPVFPPPVTGYRRKKVIT